MLKEYMGRFVVMTLSSNEAMDNDGYKIVNKMRDAIRSVDKEYVNRLRDGVGHLNFLKEFKARVAKGEEVVCSST